VPGDALEHLARGGIRDGERLRGCDGGHG
jgi:hypothetical protein